MSSPRAWGLGADRDAPQLFYIIFYNNRLKGRGARGANYGPWYNCILLIKDYVNVLTHYILSISIDLVPVAVQHMVTTGC